MHKRLHSWIAATVSGFLILGAAATWSADAPQKNWTPPPHKIYGQKLSDDTMAKHPELLSITLHGVPPDLDNVYTMFAGSYPGRGGKTGLLVPQINSLFVAVSPGDKKIPAELLKFEVVPATR